MGACDDSRLPVYRVVATGIEEARARRLGEALRIPSKHLAWRDGEASFVDRHRYLAVPTVPIDDREIVARLTEATTNHHPDIPISVTGIDYGALEKHVPLDGDEALKTAAAALETAGLTPKSARPLVGHTVFTTVAIGSDGAEEKVRETLLDTHVAYRFTVEGHPLVGPGAQIQMSFDSERNVTRLLHSTRTLEPGPSVAIVDRNTVRAQLACALPDDVEIRIRLVYFAPSLHDGLHASKHWRPSEIVPCYAVAVTRQVIDPDSGIARPLATRTRVIPATEDTRFVPSVTIEAIAREASRVEARAVAAGGTPPYTFLWGASNPTTSSERGDTVSYEPLRRDLRDTIPNDSLRRTEHVSVTVVDANGVSAQAATSLAVTARPAPDTHQSITYGCESPDDPGAWTGDRVAWQAAMGAFGGGSERFCWMADDSWPGDYIEGPDPGTLESYPWINGDADYSNWGINTANIVYYIGDSNPEVFAEMFPGANPADYNTSSGASVWAPTHTTTVQIGSHGYSVPYTGAWGAPHPNDQLQWLAMYACNLLEKDASAPSPWLRWGPAFNGLHSLLAFHTEAADSNSFCFNFPLNFLGFFIIEPQTIVQAWLSAANAANIGTPAAMGPIFNVEFQGFSFGISDFGDHYWGRGAVGPTIPRTLINGWWYIKGTDALQTFP